MDCKRIEELIFTDYIDGTLAPAALKEVEAHLALCAGCRKLASELVSASRTIRSAGKMTPPPIVWERIRRDITAPPRRSETLSFDNLFGPAQAFFARFRPAIVAVTAAALILTVLTVARLMPQRGVSVQDEIMSMMILDENGSSSSYDFGTPEENYFL